jgi:ATP-dependent DNA helicase RecQ
MARGRPTTEDALRRISGVGEYRLHSFGRVFLDGIVAHCRKSGLATDVPPPRTKPVVRAVKMSPRKELAFRLFRDGTAVADVVHQLGVSRGTVCDYLADFVLVEKPESILGWVSQDICERVAAATDIHGTDRLKPIFLELNEEVTYEDIRVVVAFLNSRG